MAKSKVKFHCGCGYTTDNYLEAALHTDSTGHTLDVLGVIQPDISQSHKELLQASGEKNYQTV